MQRADRDVAFFLGVLFLVAVVALVWTRLAESTATPSAQPTPESYCVSPTYLPTSLPSGWWVGVCYNTQQTPEICAGGDPLTILRTCPTPGRSKKAVMP